jgi:hypothetical protein
MHGLVKNSPLPAAATGKRKAKVVEEEDPLDPDSKKKRKARGPKKIRDPDMPKRPASSYLLFQNEVRKELKSKNPNMSQTELLPAIAKLWSEMTPDQKLVSSVVYSGYHFLTNLSRFTLLVNLKWSSGKKPTNDSPLH